MSLTMQTASLLICKRCYET